MKQNNSAAGRDSGKIFGLIFLAIIWIWLVYILFTRGGLNMKNIFVAAASGIIIFLPLWKRYIQPLVEKKGEK